MNISEQIALTYEDYLMLPQDGKRYEIIEGELYMAPAPTTKHQRSIGGLFRVLDRHIRDNTLGELFVSPIDVKLSRTTVIQPDIVYVSKVRSAIVTEDNIQGPPDLVIEVVSPSSADVDRGLKKKVYARYKIPHYWILDPDHQILEAYQLKGRGYRLVDNPAGDATFTPKLFPGLKIKLTDMWPRL
jgi:Uma2 family endonuclease